jgi:hypothetical protein
MPISSRVFSVFSSSSFKVSDLMSRPLIHLELIFVWGKK